jgi:hypothetical protein
MSNAIYQILGQPGWEEIKDIFNEEILESRKLVDLKTEGKSAEEIVREVIARKEAAKIVQKVLKRIETSGTLINKPKQVYR